MATAMQVILLERVDSLGNMGEQVRVKPGYARNYLLPQGKALRATKENIAYFESQKAALEKLNAERRKEAEKDSKKFADKKIVIIRHAAEGGQLYGSVSTRDIADAIVEQTGETLARNQVNLSGPLKEIGLFPVTIALHPEVKVEITVNIARSEDEAKTQAKTGHAATPAAREAANDEAAAEAAKAAFLEESALEAERAEAEEQARQDAEQAERAAEKAAKKAAKAEQAAADDEADEEKQA